MSFISKSGNQRIIGNYRLWSEWMLEADTTLHLPASRRIHGDASKVIFGHRATLKRTM
jgi:hypothetical protein